MTTDRFDAMMQGLVDTAMEIVLVVGPEDAEDEVERFETLVGDLDSFWNSNGEMSETDWSKIFADSIAEVKHG